MHSVAVRAEMDSPEGEIRDPAVLEIIESLLNLCVEREEEIARLSRELEALRAANQAASPPQPVQAEENVGRTVMVVDSSMMMRSRLVDLLSANGYRVVGSAENGLQAIEVFRRKRPELVTMDVEMPVMDGLDATRHIRAIDPDAKVVIVSERLSRSMILKAIDAGAADFLTKPLHVDRFLQVIARVLCQPA